MGPKLPGWTKDRSTPGGEFSPLQEPGRKCAAPRLVAGSHPCKLGKVACRQKQEERQNFKSQSKLYNSLKVMMRK